MRRLFAIAFLVAQALALSLSNGFLPVTSCSADPWYQRWSTNFPPIWHNGPTNDSQAAYSELCLVNPTNKTIGGTLSITINSNATSMTVSAGVVGINVGPVSSNLWVAINSLTSSNTIDLVIGSQTNLPPVHVRGIVVTSNVAHQVTLYWTKNGAGSNAPSGFLIRWGSTPASTNIIATINDASRTNWIDIAPIPNMTNFYQAAEFNSAGTSTWSSVAIIPK